MWAPRGTPKDVYEKVHSAVADTLADSSECERFVQLGQGIWPREKQTPQALALQQRAEIEKGGRSSRRPTSRPIEPTIWARAITRISELGYYGKIAVVVMRPAGERHFLTNLEFLTHAQTVLEWIAGIGLLGAMLGCIYALAVCIIVLRFARSSVQGPAPTPPVTIMVPLHGAEPRLFERCASLCRLEDAGLLQLVFGTHASGRFRDRCDQAIAGCFS